MTLSALHRAPRRQVFDAVGLTGEVWRPQSSTNPRLTETTFPPEMTKSVTRRPARNLPVWQEREPAIVSHLTPGTPATTSASVEPTPTPVAVRSPRPVV